MADTWSQIRTWWLVLPPSRPAAWQLARIRHAIRDLDRSAPVGVLGSTPEFRDLLHELGFTKVLVFERNLDFHREVSKLRLYQNPETLVEGDWLDTLGDKRGELSLILSDLTSGNVPYDQRDTFYELMGNALTKGGLFIDKILRHTAPLFRVDDLANKYASLPTNLLHINYFSCEMLFASELLDLAEVVDSSRFYDILDERLTNKRARAFAWHSRDITPPGCIWYYGRRWEKLQHGYCRGLRVLSAAEDEPSSPYFQHLSLIVHERP